jgi:PKD repeat protein
MSNGYTPILNPKTTRENRTLQWILLGFCAIGICAMSFFVPDEKTLVGNTTNYAAVSTTLVESPKADFVPVAPQPPRPNQKFMLNMDVQEAMQESIFCLAKLPNGAKYTIDFGDGQSATLKGLKARYTYKNAGDYRVTLKAEYNGVFQKLQTIMVNVASAIEIDPLVDVVER